MCPFRRTYAVAALFCSGFALQGCFNTELKTEASESDGGSSSGGGVASGFIWPVTNSFTISFAKTIYPDTASQAVQLRNPGAAAVTSVSITGIGAPFSFKGGTYPGVGGDCGDSLAAGATCTIVIEFAPAALASFSSSLNIGYHDGLASQLQSFTLSGQGSIPNYQVYVGSQSNSSIAQYTMNSLTGALSYVTTYAATSMVRGMAYDSGKSVIYAALDSTAEVAVYSVSQNDGTLSLLEKVATLAADPYTIAAHPSGGVLFVGHYSSGKISYFRVASDGRLTRIRNITVNCGSFSSIAAHPSGGWVYVGCAGFGIDRYQVDLAGDNLVFVDHTGTGGSTGDIVFNPAGDRLYAAVGSPSHTVISFSVAGDGSLASYGNYAVGGVDQRSLAIHPTKNYLFAAGGNPGAVGSGVFDPSGTISPVSTQAAGNWPSTSGLKVDPTGKFLFSANYAGGNITSYSIDGSSAALSGIGSTGLAFNPWSLLSLKLVP